MLGYVRCLGESHQYTCECRADNTHAEMKGTCHATWEGIDLGNVPYAVVSPQYVKLDKTEP